MKIFFWCHHSFLPFESICHSLIEYILQDSEYSVDEGIATRANLYLHLIIIIIIIIIIIT